MSQSPKLTFAPFVATACGLWIVAAITGSQGFTAIIGLLAIASLFFSRPSLKLPLYGWVLTAALAWITITAVWSPATGPLFSGTMTGEDFAIDVASIRLIGVAVFSALAIGAALKVREGAGEKSNTAIMIISAVMAVLITLAFFFRAEVLAFAYPDEPNEALESGAQNIQRAANSVAVFLPVGIAALVSQAKRLPVALFAVIFVLAGFALILMMGVSSRIALAFPVLTAILLERAHTRFLRGKYYSRDWLTCASVIALTALMLLVFQRHGSQSAVMSAILMLAGFGIVWVLPKHGLKTLFAGIAAYILLAPALFMGFTRAAASSNIVLPESFQARLFGWQETVAKIFERPITGHGLEATGTWKETYATRPDWLEQLSALASPDMTNTMKNAWQHYPIVPGHPHNMALELWAEAGIIGVLLVVIALLLAAMRMPAASGTNRSAVFAGAGVIGAALPLFSFAYSAWNEAYWGMLAIAACAVILLAKKRPV